MNIQIWHLIGILVGIGALIWANWMLTGAWPLIQKIIYVLLVLFGVFLILASLGILPDLGISVSG